jgi:tetratricopeptide (TPR) repeat protein
MNTNLLAAIKQLVSQQGESILSDSKRVNALLSDLAAREPKPLRMAFIKCLMYGFHTELKQSSIGDRQRYKNRLAQKLYNEEGMDLSLAHDTLDLLETVLFGKVSGTPKPAAAPAPVNEAMNKIDTHIQYAKDCLEKEDYLGAINKLTQALKIDPKNRDALSLRSMCFLFEDDYNKAMADADALMINGYLAEAYSAKGMAHKAMGNLDLALSSYVSALPLMNQSSFFDNNDINFVQREITSLNAEIKNGQNTPVPEPHDGADEVMERANRSLDKGFRFLNIEDYDRADKAFRKALYLVPYCAPAYEGLSMIASKGGNYSQAISYLEDAINQYAPGCKAEIRECKRAIKMLQESIRDSRKQTDQFVDGICNIIGNLFG